MVNHPHNNLFNRGDTERQIKIAFSGGTITNKEMHQGSFQLKEVLCDKKILTFGDCKASELTFKVHNVLTPLVGEKLTVYEVLNGKTAEPFNYGKYKVCKVNVDEQMELATEFGIEVIPTLMFFKNGEMVKKSVGVITKEEIESIFASL